jgi:hypothetical protein
VVVAPIAATVVVVELDVVLEAARGLVVVLGPLPDRFGAPVHAAARRAIAIARATTVILALGAEMPGRPRR